MKNSEVEILLVEDNPHEAQLALRGFKKFNLGNRLLHIDDGVEALDFVFGRGAYEGQPVGARLKVIFLDLKLPKVDGLEVLKNIKGDERTKGIPVVILTSSKEEPDVMAAYRLGANSYVVKPVDYEKFSQAIADLANFWVFLNQPPVGLREVKC